MWGNRLSIRKWAVFISGQGTNLQSLLDASPPIAIELVISNRSDAFGLTRAQAAKIPVSVLSKEVQWDQLSHLLKEKKIDFVFLLGFMKIIPESFIQEWKDRILNLHPSLLPNFKGLNAIERSYNEGAAMGVTIHWVTSELDSGPILLQEEVYKAQPLEIRKKEFSLEKAKIEIQKCENKMVVNAVRRVESC